MSDQSEHVGEHLILNVYDVADVALLKDLEVGLPYLENIVKELQLTVVSRTGYQFQPIGYTYAFVLSESHFTIHTYPEFRSCYIDIFCCNKDFDSHKAVNYIKKLFDTSRVTYNILKR